MTHVTTDIDENAITKLCLTVGGVQDINLCESGAIINRHYIVFVNGLIIGIIANAQRLCNTLRYLRRKRGISEYVSISINHLHRAVYIATDGGRLCRPYIIINPKTGLSNITPKHLDNLTRSKFTFDDFISEGLIEVSLLSALINS